MRFVVHLDVMPKEGISDPVGATIERFLPNLGYEGLEAFRVGKRIVFTVEAPSETDAQATVENLCKQILANQVIEDFSFEIETIK